MSRVHQITFHEPILLEESIQLLMTDRSGIYVDGTLGGGGHAEAILKRLGDKGWLIGIDGDEEAIAYSRQRLFSYGDRVSLIQDQLANIDTILDRLTVRQITGILLDLGVSSHQIDKSERGFSYLTDGPLDMRMDVSQKKNAWHVINHYSQQDLRRIFFTYGEEHHAHRIAGAIVKWREKRSIDTTGELAEIIRKVIPYRYHIKTLSRIWQSIRFEVNEELDQLRQGLEKVYGYLGEGGRIVVITYESLMDRMVKRFIRGEKPTFSKKDPPIKQSGIKFRKLTHQLVRPAEMEIQKNPRARSARMRAGEKIGSSESRVDKFNK